MIRIDAILNITQHKASAEQVSAGVQDFPAHLQESLQTLLTFEEIPSEFEILARAEALAAVAAKAFGGDTAMIGGAPFFMPALAAALSQRGITPVYAFSKRVAEDRVSPDGTVTKVSKFAHCGFVPHVPA